MSNFICEHCFYHSGITIDANLIRLVENVVFDKNIPIVNMSVEVLPTLNSFLLNVYLAASYE